MVFSYHYQWKISRVNKIKVYVKSKRIEYEVPDKLAIEGHPCHGFRKEAIVKFPGNHERAKRIAEELAKEEGLDIEIYDISDSISSRISAFFKGIKTPIIEVGGKQVNEVPSKEKLLSLLNQKEALKT